MKKYFTVFAAFAIVITTSNLLAFAKENSPQTNFNQEFDDPVFEKIVKLSQPSDEQALLSSLMGEWNYSVTVWVKPNAEPQNSTGVSINKMILGDRFLSMKSSAILNIGGHYMPFESEGLMGRDNIKKGFTSVWMDTLNPGMMTGSGTFDKKNNLIKENGNFTSAVSETSQTYRSELQFIDADNYKRLIFLKDKSGKEYKMMEFLYSKKK